MATNRHCYGCFKNDAVMDLVFGELAEMHRIPWCRGCAAPDTWYDSPFHHAEGYINGKPELSKGKCADVFKVDENMALQGKLTVTSEDTKALYNRQPHYEGGIDPITYGQDNFTPQEMNGFYKMNVVKYVSRCDRKNGLEDLKKAQDYLNLLIKSYEDKSEFFMEKCERAGRKSQFKERPFKDVIAELVAKGHIILPRETNNCWLRAVEDYLDGENICYSVTESVDNFIVTIHEDR